MDLRVNHEELNNFYDLSKNESEFLREEIDYWLLKLDELKDIWKGEDADEFYNNASSYLKRMYVVPEFFDSVNEFVIGANRQYNNIDNESKDEFEKVVVREDYDV